MSWDKNYRFRCDDCGKYCIPYDSETPYGCSSYEPPEPLDPYHYCKRCAKKLKKEWLTKFQNGDLSGYWTKSDAEIWAAKKLNLIWDEYKFKYKKILPNPMPQPQERNV